MRNTPRAARCERARANLGMTRARGEMELEMTLRKMQHKEDKMQRERGSFGAVWAGRGSETALAARHVLCCGSGAVFCGSEAGWGATLCMGPTSKLINKQAHLR